MAWARFDDKRGLNRKLRQAGFGARGLDEAAICWCAGEESDGFISTDDVEMLGLAHRHKQWRALAKALVDVGRWDAVEGGWQIHDYLEYNPSATDLAQERDWDRRRKQLYNDRELVAAVKARDKDRCRYCGVIVNWSDRKSPVGGQLDHVIPRGPGTLDNVVVACRRCNISKGGRTPEEAGVLLLDPGSLGIGQNGSVP